MSKKQEDSLAKLARKSKKLLVSHGFSAGKSINKFVREVHFTAVAIGKSGRVPISEDLLWRHGIKTRLHAEISASGQLTAIKQ